MMIDLIQQIENVKNYIIMLEDKIVELNEEIERYKRKEKMRGGKNVKWLQIAPYGAKRQINMFS